MKKLLLLLLLPSLAYGASTFTTNYNLEKPADGSTTWGSAIRDDLDTIDAQMFINSNSIADHLADTEDAHDASAISSDGGADVCTSEESVEDYLDCLDSEINSVSPGGGVSIAGDQTVTGSKTFTGTTTFDGSVNISPFTVAGVVHNDSAGLLSSSQIVNADVSTTASITRSKTAAGTAYRILANNASGVMSENAALTASRALVSDANGQLESATTTATEIGYVNGVTSAIQTQINAKQAGDSDLTAIAALTSTGILARTASNTWANRTLTGTANQVVISDGDGVSGNPTFSLPQSIGTGSSPTFAGMTLTGFSGLVKASTGALSASTLVNADVAANAAIDYSKLATLSSGNILVGSAGGVATSTAVTGDVTISNAGVTAIGSGVIVNADVNASAAIDFSKLATLASGNILVGSGGGVATSTAVTGDVTISNTGVTAIGSGVIVNADINASAAIDGSKLVAATNALAGAVSTATQSFAGLKTFYDGLKLDDDASQSTFAYYRSENHATTFTHNGGGASPSGSVNVRIVRVGDQVTIKLPTMRATTGTGTNNAFDSDTDLPSWAYPGNDVRVLVSVDDGGTSQLDPGMLVVTTTGNMSIRKTTTSASFTASTANCGTAGYHTFTYTIN